MEADNHELRTALAAQRQAAEQRRQREREAEQRRRQEREAANAEPDEDTTSDPRLFQDHLTLACAPGLVMLFGVERAGL